MSGMTTVIVPLDGSIAAEAALEPARWIAATLDSPIVILTVSAAVDQSREQAFLDRARARMGAHTSVRSFVVPGCFPGQSILQTAQTFDDPIICLSTRGHGALATAVVGRVATEILAHSELPVVLVGPSFDGSASTDDGIVQCVAERAPVAASQLGPRCAQRAGVALHLLHVDPRREDGSGPPPANSAGRAAEALRRDGIDATADDFSATDVPKAIIAVVRSLHPRLLAIRRNPPSRLIERPLGRVGIELVHLSPCPVVVDPPTMRAEALTLDDRVLTP
jgi:nucleotide-binding universal stress UspA family protein